MRYEIEDWDGAVEAVKGAERVALACHVNPDGDALGSLLGAALGLTQLGKEVAASWGAEAIGVPPAYAFLPGKDLLVPPDELSPDGVFLALDCGAADRLGSLESTARDAEHVINVDHHPGNDNFGDLNIVVPTASSTAELTVRLLQDAGVKIDRDMAICFYVGVVTDTGRFQYSNSSPDTLRLAADLLALDVPATQIAQEVFESSPFGFLKLVGRVLERATLCERERFIYSWLDLKDLEETGVGLDETDKLIDMVRATRDADVAALFKEQPDGAYRVSLRSKGPGVGAIARANGGGGHDLAAGFTATDVHAAVEEIRAALTP
jgi:phosphoesterase RecJ-like protein